MSMTRPAGGPAAASSVAGASAVAVDGARSRGVLLVAAGATGVSTAAALSVPPERFAAAVGLNQTGRQVGGALGVAVLAALLADAGSDTGPFADVYLFCTLATLAVAAAALWLVLKESH
jgi:hypothetical protein